jgi:hypothetical protein
MDNYEAGVRAGVEAFYLYFVDESENSILSDFDSRVLQQTSEYAIADALNDRNIWVNKEEK